MLPVSMRESLEYYENLYGRVIRDRYAYVTKDLFQDAAKELGKIQVVRDMLDHPPPNKQFFMMYKSPSGRFIVKKGKVSRHSFLIKVDQNWMTSVPFRKRNAIPALHPHLMETYAQRGYFGTLRMR